jgi:exodeoxyribonuclease V alpha subunit
VTARANPTRGDLLKRFLATDDAFRGIGVARAEALWKHFGEALASVLDAADVAQLAGVVPQDVAENLVTAWAEKREEGRVVDWLDRHGFERRLAWKLAKQVVRVWSTDATIKLAENPYRMLAFASWEKVDTAARRVLGVAADDERRLIAGVEAACYKRLDDKHTATDHEVILALVRSHLRCDQRLADDAIARAETDGAIVKAVCGWQPLGPAVMERFIADTIGAMLAGFESGQMRLLWQRPTNARVAEMLAGYTTPAGHRLTTEQADAALAAFKFPFLVVTGGAGTGKTTVLAALHEAIEQFGGRIVQMALSGRAARRMQEATGRDALTIAAFLHRTRDDHATIDDGTFIVIDEASMLDLPLLYRILTTLQRSARSDSIPCRLVMLGDPFQLSPIGFGLTFHLFARSPGIPRIELTTVHRQAESTGIPRVADAIRRGVVPDLPAFAGMSDGVSFLEAREHEILPAVLRVVDALGGIENARILAAVKDGPSGVHSINATLHDLHSIGKVHPIASAALAVGDPVIHLVNDYSGRNLRNGSLGVVIDGAERERLNVDFESEGTHTFASWEIDELLALAYAITLHKAQGSQFGRAVIPLTRSRLADRTWLYTAVTRAERQAVFIGERGFFANAVRNLPSASLRQTGLESYLNVDR